MAAYKKNKRIDDLQMPYFRASFDYGFGEFGLGSYLYDYSTMRTILFIPDKEEQPFPFFPIPHRKYPK